MLRLLRGACVTSRDRSDAAEADLPDPKASLDTLVENHRAFLRFLERRVGSKETAEDLLQEAFGRAVTHLHTVRDGESAVAWFYRLLRNAVIDHYRRRAAPASALERFAAELDEAVPPPEVAAEICACVSRLAGTLKPEYADALAQIDVQGIAGEGLRRAARPDRQQRRRPRVPGAAGAARPGRRLVRHLRRSRLSRLLVRPSPRLIADATAAVVMQGGPPCLWRCA